MIPVALPTHSKCGYICSEQQVLFTKNMVPVVAEQFGEATLEVEVGLDSGEVQWMRQGVVIHPGPKFTLKQKSRRRSLTIHKLALSDRGTYSCETLHDRTQAQLIVERECARVVTMRCCLFTSVAGNIAFARCPCCCRCCFWSKVNN